MNFTSFLSPVFSGWNNTGMNVQNVTFVSHLEQIHILNTAEQRWMFGTNCCGGLYMDLRQTKRQKKLRYHKSWYTGVS